MRFIKCWLTNHFYREFVSASDWNTKQYVLKGCLRCGKVKVDIEPLSYTTKVETYTNEAVRHESKIKFQRPEPSESDDEALAQVMENVKLKVVNNVE
jgi:hypothetical protein